jgi:NADPH:quinone reductase-like Zn-dependent oxidoreductase
MLLIDDVDEQSVHKPTRPGMRAHAIRIHERGGVDALRWDEIEVPDPGPGEVLIRNTAIGLNFIDPGHRSGARTEARYETPLPMVLGTEGAGVVEAVGPGVTTGIPEEGTPYTPVGTARRADEAGDGNAGHAA